MIAKRGTSIPVLRQPAPFHEAVRELYVRGVDRFAGLGVRSWAREDVVRRWRSLVVLGVLAGLSVALAVAAVSGSRRAATAFARLTEQTTGADAVVFPSQTSDAGTFDWDALREVPYVEDVAPWSLTFGTLEEGTDHEEAGSLLFMPTDDHWLRTTDRPVVIDGRMWDPTADGEVLVDEPIADEQGIQVGDRFGYHAYRSGQFGTGDPAGPMLDIEVVGIVRETSQFLFTGGMVFLSPGTRGRASADGADRERPRPSAQPREGRPRATSRPRSLRWRRPEHRCSTSHAVLDRVGTAISLERVAQALLGLAVAVAALVFVGQALARSVSLIDDDAIVLRALGFTRQDRAVAATAPHLVTAGVAVPVALLGTWASRLAFPSATHARWIPRSAIRSTGRSLVLPWC